VPGSLPPGGCLTVCGTVRGIGTGRVTEGTARLSQRMGPAQLTLRTRPGFERFSGGLEMAAPGAGAGANLTIKCQAILRGRMHGLSLNPPVN
jgi:hypothetical protein